MNLALFHKNQKLVFELAVSKQYILVVIYSVKPYFKTLNVPVPYKYGTHRA